jgi:hypothetical protein
MTERYDEFWAEYFGITVAELRTAGLSIVRHVGLADYPGVWFFLHGSRLVVSAPESWLEQLRNRLGRTPNSPRLPTQTEIAELFGASLDRTIGPTFQGAIEARHFRPFRSAHTRILVDTDANAVADFRDACSVDDLSASALDKASLFRSGYFDGGRIVSLAGFRPWSSAVGDLCVLTVPDRRGQGCAKAAVSSVLAAAIADDRVPIYQTLEANAPAVRIALALGYARYSSRIAVRLTTDGPY